MIPLLAEDTESFEGVLVPLTEELTEAEFWGSLVLAMTYCRVMSSE